MKHELWICLHELLDLGSQQPESVITQSCRELLPELESAWQEELRRRDRERRLVEALEGLRRHEGGAIDDCPLCGAIRVADATLQQAAAEIAAETKCETEEKP